MPKLMSRLGRPEMISVPPSAVSTTYTRRGRTASAILLTVTMPSTVTATMTSSSTRRIRQCSRTATAETARRTLSFMSFICPPKR